MAAHIDLLARRPRAWGMRVQRLRHLIQALFLLFIADVTLQHALASGVEEGAAASPEAYCPLGGFESLYRFVTSGGYYVSHIHASNLVLAVGILLTSLLARGFFCGWVCPFGTIQGSIAALSHRLQRRLPRLGREMRALRARAAPLAAVDRPLRYLKYLVLVWILAGTALYGTLVFRDVDPWYALTMTTAIELSGGMVVLGVVLIASFFVERPWCRYACPLGAIVGLVGRLSPLKIERESAACLACGICTKQCPMGIPVDRLTRVQAVECNSCLQCVGACPTEGGLALKLALPGVRRQEAGQTAILSGAAR